MLFAASNMVCVIEHFPNFWSLHCSAILGAAHPANVFGIQKS